jgi:hypothetical protein
MRPRNSERGISLADVTIMLMVMSVMSAVMTPVIGDYVNEARRVKAAEDVQVLSATFSRFAFDAQTEMPSDKDWRHYDVLVGEGETPMVGTGGDAGWASEADANRVGRLGDHLITNAPGYSTSRNPVAFWARGWRGPYLGTGVGPDPWGHRYAINVGSLTRRGACLVVLSAGPNGVIETPFARSGLLAGGDDLLAVIGIGN